MNEKLRAAAQAALEALETLMLERDCIYRRAINSLKAALAEPAIKESLTGAEQEPVAWKHPDKNMVFWEDTKKVDEYHGFKLTIPLYASPPAAQPEPTCPECKAAVLYECVACSSNNYPPVAQPEQEPVACIKTNGELMWLKKPSTIYSKPRPLYAAPPRREWVCLTDKEIDEIYKAHHTQYGECKSVNFGYERAIEAKLREKND